jgi:hypothetical protein
MRPQSLFSWALLATISVTLPGSSPASVPQPQARTAYLNADTAGIDFAFQGEYVGRWRGNERLAAQVIAEGEGRFALQLLPGGLPGEGWDGVTRWKSSARLEGDHAIFSGGGWNGRIADGSMRGTDRDGSPFHLQRVVRKSPMEGRPAPSNAVVLFNGTTTDAWNNGKLFEGNLLGPGTTTKQRFRDFTLHVEFRTPFMPQARGQGRGNSGIKMAGIYEVQILDSFGLEGKANECGAVYARKPPSINMCYPPLSWQTFDIDFRAPRFDSEGRKTKEARITVRHNGILVHDDVPIQPYLHQIPFERETAPLFFQDHRCPVYFRNVWIIER